MPRGVHLGRRSGIGAASRRGHRQPKTEVPVPQRHGREMAKDCSPHSYGQRYRRSYRRNGRY
jgi:hypothetical protein